MAVVGPPIWQSGVWADTVWAEGVWRDEADATESLGEGDLTTQFAIWLRGVEPDVNTEIRDRLATEYSYAAGTDVTTLLTRFLRERT